MTRDLKELLKAAQAPGWSELAPQQLRAWFAFTYVRTQGSVVSGAVIPGAGVPGIEVERSKAELSQRAAESSALLGQKSTKHLILSSAILDAIGAILLDVHSTLIKAGEKGKPMRQSTEARLVEFQADYESFRCLLVSLFVERAGGSANLEWESRAAACFKCGQLLIQSLSGMLSALQLDEDAALGADRIFAHVSNLSRMAIVSRQMFPNSSSGQSPGRQATEDIMSLLGVDA